MSHPLIAEFCRASNLHPDFLRRCQRVFRMEVQPMLDERETLLAHNAELQTQLTLANEIIHDLKGEKRGPGRPRKTADVVPA